MGLFRAHRRWGGFAALLPLALQFVASFGHVHVEAFAGHAANASLAQAVAPGDPPGHDDDHAGKVCDICATLTLLSAAQLAAPPALVVPIAFEIAPTGQ